MDTLTTALQTYSETSNLAKRLHEEENAHNSSKALSLYKNCPTATAQDIACDILRLSVNFPRMTEQKQVVGGQTISFWTILAEQAIADGWSAERFHYATTLLLRNHRYPTFTIAEFLAIDNQVKELTLEEFNSIIGSKTKCAPICHAFDGYKRRRLYVADAQRLGLPYDVVKQNIEIDR